MRRRLWAVGVRFDRRSTFARFYRESHGGLRIYAVREYGPLSRRAVGRLETALRRSRVTLKPLINEPAGLAGGEVTFVVR